jgi:hypothetical protein
MYTFNSDDDHVAIVNRFEVEIVLSTGFASKLRYRVGIDFYDRQMMALHNLPMSRQTPIPVEVLPFGGTVSGKPHLA